MRTPGRDGTILGGGAIVHPPIHETGRVHTHAIILIHPPRTGMRAEGLSFTQGAMTSRWIASPSSRAADVKTRASHPRMVYSGSLPERDPSG